RGGNHESLLTDFLIGCCRIATEHYLTGEALSDRLVSGLISNDGIDSQTFPMEKREWPKVAVVGAGAVGSFFGGMLARAGVAVTLIGRAPHVEAIKRCGLFIDSIHFQETISIGASTSFEVLHDAAMVLVCVKSRDTEDAARKIAGCLAPDAIVLSL